jgi:1-acyl-sn-glycerol-3-phosphate acyltransferase
MIRFFIAILYTILSVLFSLPAHLAFKAQIKKDNITGWKKAWKYVRRFFKALIFISGTKIEVRGMENLPKDQPVFYVGNHRSYFDIIILQTLTPGPVGFVAKKEFKKFPLLPLYMEDIGCLFLDRDNPREGLKTISDATEYMKKGLSISLFPEGTRNHGTELLPFKSGGYRIAEKSQSPLVVTAMSGLDGILENNKPFGIKKKHVIIEFGSPVYPHQMDKNERKEFYEHIPDQITEMMSKHEL